MSTNSSNNSNNNNNIHANRPSSLSQISNSYLRYFESLPKFTLPQHIGEIVRRTATTCDHTCSLFFTGYCTRCTRYLAVRNDVPTVISASNIITFLASEFANARAVTRHFRSTARPPTSTLLATPTPARYEYIDNILNLQPTTVAPAPTCQRIHFDSVIHAVINDLPAPQACQLAHFDPAVHTITADIPAPLAPPTSEEACLLCRRTSNSQVAEPLNQPSPTETCSLCSRPPPSTAEPLTSYCSGYTQCQGPLTDKHRCPAPADPVRPAPVYSCTASTPCTDLDPSKPHTCPVHVPPTCTRTHINLPATAPTFNGQILSQHTLNASLTHQICTALEHDLNSPSGVIRQHPSVSTQPHIRSAFQLVLRDYNPQNQLGNMPRTVLASVNHVLSTVFSSR